MPEKSWVFDTVVLSNFLLADCLFILEERYHQRGFLTVEVYDEISAGIAEFPKLRRVETLIENRILDLISLSSEERLHYLELINHLGKGESSCLAFSTKHTCTVMTDDRAARSQCSQMKLPFSGTLGILKASCLDLQISQSQADRILDEMVRQGFYSPIRKISDIL